MGIHKIEVKQELSRAVAKNLAQILVSAQGIGTPVQVRVVCNTVEHLILLE